MNRRGFLGLLAGAIAGAGVGVRLGKPSDLLLAPEKTTPATLVKLLDARHLYSYDVVDNCFLHRIDVMLGGNQWGVSVKSDGKELDAERELAPALAHLEEALTREAGDCEVRVGKFLTHSADQWFADPNLHAQWPSIGTVPT